MGRKISIAITIVGLVGVIALYVNSVMNDGFTIDLTLKAGLVFISLIISLIKLLSGGFSSGSAIAKASESMAENAFSTDKKSRKKLIGAIILYNENKPNKAFKELSALRPMCRTSDDYRLVWSFAALCLMDTYAYSDAEVLLNELVYRGITTPNIYNNLGYVHMKMGKSQEAVDAFESALMLDPDFYSAHMNLANLYFADYELSAAKESALKAHECDPTQKAAPSLLAVLCAMDGESEESEKYFHIAVSRGESPDELRESIAYYTEKD